MAAARARVDRRRWLRPGRLVALLAVCALLAAALSVLLYRQRDDPRRIRAREAYLRELEARGAGLPAGRLPNLVVVLFDDLGVGDVGVYGGRAIATPRLDRLAAEGARFTHAYATSPYCSASRAGLLTGRYPVRYGLDHVLQAPWSWQDVLLRLGRRNRRLPGGEVTLAAALEAAGWETAAIGKWHLGDAPPALPGDRGFDRFYGLLHSNDQGVPTLWSDRRVIERPAALATLTRRYTRQAVEWIGDRGERPFFLYLAHTFPHVPLAAGQGWRGSSAAGLYGDVVEELDASVGAVLDALDRRGLAERTLLVVTSDNGPWFQGSAGGLRGRKMSVFEGGVRVPLLVRWPGRVEAGAVIDVPVMGIDLFPTVLELAGLPLPGDREVDGVSLAGLLGGGPPPAPRPLLFFQIGELTALRLGRFKYHARHGVFYGNPMDWPWAPMHRRGPWLFDLERDPGESYDVTLRHPAVAAELATLLAAERRALDRDPGGWLAAAPAKTDS